MPSARCDQEITVLVNIINETVCLINSPAPAFSVFQRLRFSNSGGNTIALDIFYQIVNSPQRFSVLLLPVKIIVPGFIDQSLFIQWFLNQFVLSTTVGTKLIEGSVQGT